MRRGESAGNPDGGQCARTGKGPGFDLEHFQIVIQLHAGTASGGDARVDRDRVRPSNTTT